MYAHTRIYIYTLITSTKKLKKSQVKESLIPNKETVNIRRKDVIIGKNSSEEFGKLLQDDIIYSYLG